MLWRASRSLWLRLLRRQPLNRLSRQPALSNRLEISKLRDRFLRLSKRLRGQVVARPHRQVVGLGVWEWLDRRVDLVARDIPAWGNRARDIPEPAVAIPAWLVLRDSLAHRAAQAKLALLDRVDRVTRGWLDLRGNRVRPDRVGRATLVCRAKEVKGATQVWKEKKAGIQVWREAILGRPGLRGADLGLAGPLEGAIRGWRAQAKGATRVLRGPRAGDLDQVGPQKVGIRAWRGKVKAAIPGWKGAFQEREVRQAADPGQVVLPGVDTPAWKAVTQVLALGAADGSDREQLRVRAAIQVWKAATLVGRQELADPDARAVAQPK